METFDKKKTSNIVKAEIPGMVIREIDLPEKKIEKRKVKDEIAKTKAAKKTLPKVASDGSINTFEIVTSGGLKFDNEVVRVVKKMLKRIPA